VGPDVEEDSFLLGSGIALEQQAGESESNAAVGDTIT